MYAVIASGGKQYKVETGQLLAIEQVTANVGETIEFPTLMVVNDDDLSVGAPYLNTKVKAAVIEHGRGKKIKIIKFRRRKHYRRQMGHRQNYTMVKITEIA